MDVKATAGISDKKVFVTGEGGGKRIAGKVVGLDVHRQFVQYCVFDGDNVKIGRVDNSKAGLTALTGICKRAGVKEAVIESTGRYHLYTTWSLNAAGVRVAVVNPCDVPKLEPSKKTDKVDCENLARLHKGGLTKSSLVMAPDFFKAKDNVRFAAKTMEMGTSYMNRVQSDIALWGGMIGEAPEGIKPAEFMKKIAHTKYFAKAIEALAASGSRDPKGVLDEAGIGRHIKKEHELDYLVEFVRILRENRALYSFTDDLSEYHKSAAKAERYYGEFLEFCAATPWLKEKLKLLMTVPEIGIKTALTVVAECPVVDTFPSTKKWTKWCGMAPKVSQSGGKAAYTKTRYRGGNRYVRTALYKAASVVVMDKGSPFGKLYRRLRDSKKPYKLAVFAVATKMSRIIFQILKTGKPFDAGLCEGEKKPAGPEEAHEALEKGAKCLRKALETAVKRSGEAFKRIDTKYSELSDTYRRLCGETLKRVKEIEGNLAEKDRGSRDAETRKAAVLSEED